MGAKARQMGREMQREGSRELSGQSRQELLAHATRLRQRKIEGDKKQPLPQDHHRALGIDLLQGARGRRFYISEVPL